MGTTSDDQEVTGQALLDFAVDTIEKVNVIAGDAGAALPQNNLRRGGAGSITTPEARQSVDVIKKWIKDAGSEADLERQEIGGLRKTVMQSGKTLWLSPAGRRWDKVDSDKLVEEAERQRAEEARKRRVAEEERLAKEADEEKKRLLGLDESSEADSPIGQRMRGLAHSTSESASVAAEKVKQSASEATSSCSQCCRQQ